MSRAAGWLSLLLILVLIQKLPLQSQPIQWMEITSSVSLPDGVKLWKGERSLPALQIWALEVDLKNPQLGVRPFQGESALVSDFSRSTGAFAAVNGGYFGGSTSYSAVVVPEMVNSQNVAAVTRNGLPYPVMRSFFSLNTDLNPSIDWIYHFGNEKENIYAYASPLPYSLNDAFPKPAPDQSKGIPMQNLLVGIGGGPVLVRDGKINITYNQEIMWGSGVGLSNRDPRTGVGFTSDKRIFLVTADGRQAKSEGVSLTELAEVFLSFQCTQAMNLDGGGSSAMAVNGSLVSSPSELRKVPSILAVTQRNALQVDWKPIFEKVLDTQDTTTVIKGSWFESANTGYYGSSRSMLSARGDGSSIVEYTLSIPRDTIVQVYAWWVSATNRAKDTPILIKHKKGNTLLKLDQTQKGSTWNYLGEFSFHNDGTEFIRIFNQNNTGEYVVADAIKLLSFGLPDSSVSSVSGPVALTKKRLIIAPNPAGQIVRISYADPITKPARIILSDPNGRVLKEIMFDALQAGSPIVLEMENIENGLYFIQLRSENLNEHASLIIMR